jgi:hypothetical protein
MIRFLHLYTVYRRSGLDRLSAIRFAWMVAAAGVNRIITRSPVRR